MGRAPPDALSPSDVSLMVMGSPSTPNLGGSGAPSDACVWGASPPVGSDGVGAGRDGALSTPAGGWELEEPTKQRVRVRRYDNRHRNIATPRNKLRTRFLGGGTRSELLCHGRLGLLKGPLQPEKRLAYEERWKNGKTKTATSKRLTPQGERLAFRHPDQWASSHPASGLQAPRGQALA